MQLADLDLAQARPGRYADQILDLLDSAIQDIGYGQDWDVAWGVAVRRRWWSIQMRTERRLNMRLLEHDLDHWRELGMENEIRNLRLTLNWVRAGDIEAVQSALAKQSGSMPC